MKPEYDLTKLKLRKNPYASKLKKPVTTRSYDEAGLRAVASSDAFAFLADPAEDIYTATDGEPFRDAI